MQHRWMGVMMAVMICALLLGFAILHNNEASPGAALSEQELRTTIGGGPFQVCSGDKVCNQSCIQCGLASDFYFIGNGTSTYPVCHFNLISSCVADDPFYCPGWMYTQPGCPQPAYMGPDTCRVWAC